MALISKNKYDYTALFCEENIWLLGKSLLEENWHPEDLAVLLLSNAKKRIPLFAQTLCEGANPVFWDYHVILLHTPTSGVGEIFDFDSRLPFPIPLATYAPQTFPAHENLPSQFHVFLRAVSLKSYHRHFHSDRTHMLDSKGRPLSPFPPYPLITIEEEKERISLWDYLDMSKKLNDDSQVYHCQAFLQKWVQI